MNLSRRKLIGLFAAGTATAVCRPALSNPPRRRARMAMLGSSISSRDKRAVPKPPYTPPYWVAPTSPYAGGSVLQRIYIYPVPDGGTANIPYGLYDGHVVISASRQPSGITVNCNNSMWRCTSMNQGWGDNRNNGALVTEVPGIVYVNDFWFANPTPSRGGDWQGDGLLRDAGIKGPAPNFVVRRFYGRGAQAALTSTHYSGDFDMRYFLIEDLREPADTGGHDHGIYLGANGTATLTDGMIRGRTFPINESPSSDFRLNEVGDMLKCRMKVANLTRVHVLAENGNVGRPFDFCNGGVITMTDCYGQISATSNNANMIGWGEEQQKKGTNRNYANDGRTHELHIHGCVFDLYWQNRYRQGRFIYAPPMDAADPPTVWDITDNVIFNINPKDKLWDGGLLAHHGVDLKTKNLCIDSNGNVLK